MITFSTTNFGSENEIKTTLVLNSERPELQVVLSYVHTHFVHATLMVKSGKSFKPFFSTHFINKTELEIEKSVVNALNIHKKALKAA